MGSELISSDGVALYELIKNAFDAGSHKGVRIEVIVRLPGLSRSLRTQVEDAATGAPGEIMPSLADLRENLAARVDENAPDGIELAEKLRQGRSFAAIRDLVRQANTITIADRGHGMSLAQLNDVYLTIGTRFRLKERERQPRDRQDPILGEKGLGRLAVMRLGEVVNIRTTRAGETHWNLLNIDWSYFSHDSDALIDSIRVAPEEGMVKDDPSVQGTWIEVSDLNAEWDSIRTQRVSRA